MKRWILVLLAVLPVSFSACSRQAAAPASSQGPAAASQIQASATTTANATAANAVSENAAATPAGSQPGVADTANGSDDAPVGTTSLEKIAELPAQHQLPDGRWKAGINYDAVVPAQPTAVAPGKVEVLEVFWYACPHCYALEPYLTAWRKAKADYIEFVRVPIMWGPIHRAHAQLYYTLKQLGRNDLDDKVFETLHQEQNPLMGNSPEETFQRQLDFARQNGIDAEAFRKAYNSFAVNSDLQRADEITQRYHVEGVPEIIINGKYTTDVGKAGSHENLIAEINDLAAGEHKH